MQAAHESVSNGLCQIARLPAPPYGGDLRSLASRNGLAPAVVGRERQVCRSLRFGARFGDERRTHLKRLSCSLAAGRVTPDAKMRAGLAPVEMRHPVVGVGAGAEGGEVQHNAAQGKATRGNAAQRSGGDDG